MSQEGGLQTFVGAGSEVRFPRKWLVIDPAEAIRARRESLRVQVNDLADSIGLTPSEYVDLELYPHEFGWMTLGVARRMCGALGLSLVELANVAPPPATASISPTSLWHRHRLIKDRRTARGLTQEELAERIGYEPYIVPQMEHAADFLESMSVGAVVALANALEVDPGLLLGGG